jgi:ferrous iron transport protein B
MASSVMSLVATNSPRIRELPIKNGQLIFIQDLGRIAFDYKDTRVFYNQIVELENEVDRLTLDNPLDGYYFVIGTGCAIPGVMACRTIKDEKERTATAMITPFMPCGAKLPVISLFAGAFFSESMWVGPIMYFVGIIIIFVCAWIIKLLTGARFKKSYFIIELPEYKFPSFGKAAKSMLSRGWSYIVKAGTVILVCNFVVILMQSFNWKFQYVEDINQSILHDIATPFGYVISPFIGVAVWQLAAAAITGFIAKENVVGTLAVAFVGLENLIDTEELEIIGGTGGEIAGIIAITKVAALAYLMFNLFTPPCFAAMGAMRSEIKENKWFWGGIGMQLGVGYSIAFLVFFFGTLFTTANFGSIWMPVVGWIITLGFIGILIFLIIKKQRQFKTV